MTTGAPGDDERLPSAGNAAPAAAATHLVAASDAGLAAARKRRFACRVRAAFAGPSAQSRPPFLDEYVAENLEHQAA